MYNMSEYMARVHRSLINITVCTVVTVQITVTTSVIDPSPAAKKILASLSASLRPYCTGI